MSSTNKFTLLQNFDVYVDFDKELFSLPDEGKTSIDMRLTFNTEDRTCYYTINTHNDSGIVVDWEKTHYISWLAGLSLLAADGVEIPKALA